MPIRPEEIDPTIQNALKERLTTIFAAQPALDPVAARVRSAGMQQWRETARRYAGHFWAGGLSFAASLAAMPVVAPSNEGLAVLLFLLLSGLGVGLVARGFAKTQQELTGFVRPEVMRGATHLIALTRAEQLYCEAVAALIDAGPVVGETVQKEILQQLNSLLQNHRKLDAPLQQFQAASASASIEALDGELADLTRRRDALEDDTARGMMEQSIALCSRRLEHARAMEPAREQAQAQQELILQTLASVQASLVRAGTAPAAPAAAEVAELQHSVTQMNRQASAVEEAVAEVVALNA